MAGRSLFFKSRRGPTFQKETMSTIYGYLWAKYSRQYLKEHPLCVYCRRRGKATPSRVTDHIRPAKRHPELFWDPANHQALCTTCHVRDKQREELGFVDRLKGGTILCVASGPSLIREDVEYARDKVHATIVTNTTFRLVPWTNVVYAADSPWWAAHLSEVERLSPSAERWTCSLQAARLFKLNYVRPERKPGLSRDASCVHTGTNSGYQAINLAFHLGARRIVLLGYDMQRTGGRSHWHGDHVGKGLHNGMNFELALQAIPRLAIDLQSEGVEVVNCSRQTAIKSFRRAAIREVLA